MNCLSCKYHRIDNDDVICDKIAEKLLSTKGCNAYECESVMNVKETKEEPLRNGNS